MVWDWIIALYLFLAGLGAGAFIFAALLKPELKKLRLGAMIIALVAVAVGTVMLMVDARAGFANPVRFFYLVSNLSSVMAWGVVLLSLFLIVAFIDCILVGVKKKTVRALDIAGAVLALGVATYTGVLLGVSMVYPLWNIVVLPILFVVSALSSGFAAVGLYGFASAKDELAQVSFKPKASIVLPILEAVLIIVLLVVTMNAGGYAAEAGRASVAAIISGSYAVTFWIGVIALGIVLPLVLEIAAAGRIKTARKEGKDQPGAGGSAALADASVVLGAFCLRCVIVLAAVAIIL